MVVQVPLRSADKAHCSFYNRDLLHKFRTLTIAVMIFGYPVNTDSSLVELTNCTADIITSIQEGIIIMKVELIIHDTVQTIIIIYTTETMLHALPIIIYGKPSSIAIHPFLQIENLQMIRALRKRSVVH